MELLRLTSYCPVVEQRDAIASRLLLRLAAGPSRLAGMAAGMFPGMKRHDCHDMM